MIDWVDVGPLALRERRAKGIRSDRSEMAGLAPASIVSERAIQRYKTDFILRKIDDESRVTQRGLYTWRV